MEAICDKCKTCQFKTRTYTCEGKTEPCYLYKSEEEFDKGALAYYAQKAASGDNFTGD